MKPDIESLKVNQLKLTIGLSYQVNKYHHDPHRSGKVTVNFLGNFSGYLHCDMWQAYKQLPSATLIGCWAHVRRKRCHLLLRESLCLNRGFVIICLD